MQDEKVHFTGLVRTIKNKLHDWWVSYDRKLWTARIFVYSFLLLLVIFVGAIVFTHFNLYHTDASSARYMLSALVQSQAAIVAIVITLTLIAVQLTASAYSPRVIDIFKKNPDMWLLLGCYGVSIFYGFIVLKLTVGKEGDFVSQSVIWSLGFVSVSFESCVSLAYFSLAYWLGVFTFVALFPYMWYIIELLKSENIINRLAIEITGDKILNSEEDPIQPIMDIIHGSIMKYDLETTRVGLNAVTDQVIKVIDSDKEKEISKRFCDHLARVSRLAISRVDEESTIEVIKKFENFGKSTVEKGLGYATEDAVKSLEEVGKAAAEKGLEGATTCAEWSLGVVGKAAVEKGLEGAMFAVMSLGEVGKAAVEKGLEGAMFAVISIGMVGEAAAGKGLESAVNVVEPLGEIGEAAVEKGLGNVATYAVWTLGEIGEAAVEKGLGNVATHAVWTLGEIGEAAVEKGLEEATEIAAFLLGEVGEAAAGKGLEEATEIAAESLERVGEAAAEKGLEEATKQAAESLAVLTILSEEIVKTAIQDCESELKEEDSDSFQKFMKIYKQKLEELRAEK